MKLYEITFERVEAATIVVEAKTPEHASDLAIAHMDDGGAIWGGVSSSQVVEISLVEGAPGDTYIDQNGKVKEVEDE